VVALYFVVVVDVLQLLICALQLKYNFICDLMEYKTEPVYIRVSFDSMM